MLDGRLETTVRYYSPSSLLNSSPPLVSTRCGCNGSELGRDAQFTQEVAPSHLITPYNGSQGSAHLKRDRPAPEIITGIAPSTEDLLQMAAPKAAMHYRGVAGLSQAGVLKSDLQPGQRGVCRDSLEPSSMKRGSSSGELRTCTDATCHLSTP